uniref:Putative secreted protein n=1 Tax=Anopheles darlingi TaxID=43151 RepID=A0A2M4D482_ANODA
MKERTTHLAFVLSLSFSWLFITFMLRRCCSCRWFVYSAHHHLVAVGQTPGAACGCWPRLRVIRAASLSNRETCLITWCNRVSECRVQIQCATDEDGNRPTVRSSSSSRF